MSEEETMPTGEREPDATNAGPTGALERALGGSAESGGPAGEAAQPRLPADGLASGWDSSTSGATGLSGGASMSDEARLFAEIVTQPPVRARETSAQLPSRSRARFGWWIVYALLIALVALPLLLDRPLLSRVIRAGPGAVGMLRTIETLGGTPVVLVAVDYDPATSGEMSILAETIVAHLMDREARVVAVSLLPAGGAMAQELLDGLAQDREGYRDGYGQKYLNLGYVPGQAAGVRLLAQSLRTAAPSDFFGTPLSQIEIAESLYGAHSFDLIVDLTASQDTVRWWIEQAGAPRGVPIAAGTSASVAPLAKAYFETEPAQLVGLLGGVSDAAMYDTLHQGQVRVDGPLATRLDSQLAGTVLLVCVILVGNGVYLVRRFRARED